MEDLFLSGAEVWGGSTEGGSGVVGTWTDKAAVGDQLTRGLAWGGKKRSAFSSLSPRLAARSALRPKCAPQLGKRRLHHPHRRGSTLYLPPLFFLLFYSFSSTSVNQSKEMNKCAFLCFHRLTKHGRVLSGFSTAFFHEA